MGTYRVEWPCCGSVTETDAWEPSECPICEADALRKDAERYRWLRDKCNHVRVGVHIQFSSNERDADAAIDAAMQGANDELSRTA